MLDGAHAIAFRAKGRAFGILHPGQASFGGSGGDRLRSAVEQVIRSIETRGAPPTHPTDAALVAATLIGIMKAQELASVEEISPLLLFFGGGYEIVTVSGAKLVKLDQVAYLFWFADVDDTGAVKLTPRRVLRPSYVDGVLAVRAADVHLDHEERRIQLVDDSVHFVKAPHERAIPAGWSPTMDKLVDFGAPCVCSCMIVTRNSHVLAVRVRADMGQQAPVKVGGTGLAIRITFTTEYLESLANDIAQVVPATSIQLS